MYAEQDPLQTSVAYKWLLQLSPNLSKLICKCWRVACLFSKKYIKIVVVHAWNNVVMPVKWIGRWTLVYCWDTENTNFAFFPSGSFFYFLVFLVAFVLFSTNFFYNLIIPLEALSEFRNFSGCPDQINFF